MDPNQVGGDVHFFEISPNHRYIAYGYENCGDERYTLTILDTATNKILEEETVDNLGKSKKVVESGLHPLTLKF